MLVVVMCIAGAKVTRSHLYDCSIFIPITDLTAWEPDFNSQTLESKAYASFAAIQGYISAIVMAFCGFKIYTINLCNALSFLIAWIPYVVVCFCKLTNVHVNDILYAICTLFWKTSTIVVIVEYMISNRGLRSLLFMMKQNWESLF